jgi:hypothetical protein
MHEAVDELNYTSTRQPVSALVTPINIIQQHKHCIKWEKVNITYFIIYLYY